MKSKTKKQLIQDIEEMRDMAEKRLEKLQNALATLRSQQHVARSSAGKLRLEVHNLDLDNDLRAKLIKMIDSHINEL